MEADEVAEIRTGSDDLARWLAELQGGDSRLSRLSEIERHIVVLVRAGHTNDEIARRVCSSAKAVEWSRTKIYRKLRADEDGSHVFEATCREVLVAAPEPTALPSAASEARGIDPNEERT